MLMSIEQLKFRSPICGTVAGKVVIYCTVQKPLPVGRKSR